MAETHQARASNAACAPDSDSRLDAPPTNKHVSSTDGAAVKARSEMLEVLRRDNGLRAAVCALLQVDYAVLNGTYRGDTCGKYVGK